MRNPHTLLKEAGIRPTHQRIEIFRQVSRSTGHPSAEEVHRALLARMPTLSLDTVYRALAALEREGLISRVEILDDRSRFDPNTSPHHHFVCVRCREVRDFDWPAFDRMRPPRVVARWGRDLRSHVEVRGVCIRCLEKEKKRTAPRRRPGR